MAGSPTPFDRLVLALAEVNEAWAAYDQAEREAGRKRGDHWPWINWENRQIVLRTFQDLEP